MTKRIEEREVEEKKKKKEENDRATATRVHGDEEGGVPWDPPETEPLCRL